MTQPPNNSGGDELAAIASRKGRLAQKEWEARIRADERERVAFKIYEMQNPVDDELLTVEAHTTLGAYNYGLRSAAQAIRNLNEGEK